MNEGQKENERICPDLIKLRLVTEDEKETVVRQREAAFCYTFIALAMSEESNVTR